MWHSEKQSIERRIDFLIISAELLDDFELQSEIAKYLCILSSAFLEAGCKDIFSRYANPRSDPTVLSFVNNSLGYFRNPNYERILQFIGRFDKNKRVFFENNVDDEQKDAINSIVSNRNNLAHGHNVGVSLAWIKGYYSSASRFLNYVERNFL